MSQQLGTHERCIIRGLTVVGLEERIQTEIQNVEFINQYFC